MIKSVVASDNNLTSEQKWSEIRDPKCQRKKDYCVAIITKLIIIIVHNSFCVTSNTIIHRSHNRESCCTRNKCSLQRVWCGWIKDTHPTTCVELHLYRVSSSSTLRFCRTSREFGKDPLTPRLNFIHDTKRNRTRVSHLPQPDAKNGPPLDRCCHQEADQKEFYLHDGGLITKKRQKLFPRRKRAFQS